MLDRRSRWRERERGWLRAGGIERARASRALRYGAGAGAVLAAFALRLALAPWIPGRLIYWSFYAAVMVAATFGGFGPGLLATALSVVVVSGWILPRPLDSTDVIAVGLFATTGLVMTVLAGLYRDARAQVAAHEATLARRDSEEQFRAFFHNTAVGTAQLDVQGRLLVANRCLCRITGYEENELSGLRLVDLVRPEDRDALAQLLRNFAGGELRSFDTEARLLARDGRTTWVHLTGGRIHDLAGGAPRIACVVHDVTARHEAEAERERLLGALEERDRRKDEFLAMLSHELRNPLAPIRNSVYVLEHAVPASEQSRRAHAVIDRQVQHLTRLVDDLLDVNRIARGKIRLRREPLDLRSLVLRSVEDHREVFLSSGVELTVACADGALPVVGDATRLAQVVGNLLSNAAKFTPRAGRTTVSVEARDAAAVLRVRDDGPGIAPEMLPHLFEPFVQADTTLDRSRGGLGLGLSLVRSIVEMHGGSVEARSAAGEGTEFTVRLPLDSTAGTSVDAAAEAPAPRATRRVLVIEDNPDAAQSLKEALELSGHQVEVALSGDQGLDRARCWRPEVVLCDLGLPGTTGYEVARAIRAEPQLRSTRLIALTGYALEEDVERCWAAGFDRHLAKPPDPAALDRELAASPGPASGSDPEGRTERG